MNKCTFIGRLTKDPQVSHGNTDMARFTLAVDRRYKRDGDATADFPQFIAFGKVVDVIEKYVSKGRKIGVVARFQSGSYTNKDGQKVYTNDFVVEEIDLLDSASGNNNSRPQQNQKTQAAPAPDDGWASADEDPDLPWN